MITKQILIEAIKANDTIAQAAKDLNITERHFYTLKNKFNIDLETITKTNNNTILLKQKNEELKEKLNEYKKTNEQLLKELNSKDKDISKILDIKNSIDYKGNAAPEWLKKDYKKSSGLSIPTLFCSDEHWGEVVKKEQVNGVNEYNKFIARQRYKNLINNYLEVTHTHLNNVDLERMVLNLGGDNVSGDIHDELSLTNDLTTMEAVYDYVEHKEQAIKELLNSGVKMILINCVRGNHDRNTAKTHSKNVLETSSAYLVYKFLQKLFSNDKRVQFNIATGIDCLYQLNNHKMLLTHGDQFKGGNGIGGITIPILRGFYKKQANYNATGNGFDSMCIGHFHQFTSINNGQVIINGSLKGFDEYSQKMGFSFQDPSQAFWLTHPERGITIQLPIFTNDKVDKQQKFEEWVSFKTI